MGKLLVWVRALPRRARLAALRFVRESKAVSTVEYAMLVIAVIAIVVAAAGAMTGAFNTLFDTVTEEIGDGADAITEPPAAADQNG